MCLEAEERQEGERNQEKCVSDWLELLPLVPDTNIYESCGLYVWTESSNHSLDFPCLNYSIRVE